MRRTLIAGVLDWIRPPTQWLIHWNSSPGTQILVSHASSSIHLIEVINSSGPRDGWVHSVSKIENKTNRDVFLRCTNLSLWWKMLFFNELRQFLMIANFSTLGHFQYGKQKSVGHAGKIVTVSLSLGIEQIQWW